MKKTSRTEGSEHTETSTALYRKYRPHTFGDVEGQDHIVTVLESSAKQGTIAHAYLFAGGRGTGKTSIARIFARGIGTSENDIYEIDAASNRGIDDIRELRDAVHVLPFESKYKVYIIDEAHMLTKEAFNALLKTLEEPPAHAVFILATTEFDAVPETIVSRCQSFSFKKPTLDTLRNLVSGVAKKEGVKIEAGVADLVALLGDGSFRDTLGMLQKVIAAAGGTERGAITLADTEKIVGAPRSVTVNNFLTALATKDKAGALAAVTEALGQGVDPKLYTMLVLEKARYALLLKASPTLRETIASRLSPADMVWVENSVAASPMTSVILSELLTAYDLCGRAAIPSLPLELAVLRVCGE